MEFVLVRLKQAIPSISDWSERWRWEHFCCLTCLFAHLNKQINQSKTTKQYLLRWAGKGREGVFLVLLCEISRLSGVWVWRVIWSKESKGCIDMLFIYIYIDVCECDPFSHSLFVSWSGGPTPLKVQSLN